jgi:SpoIID/LytB domain protein
MSQLSQRFLLVAIAAAWPLGVAVQSAPGQPQPSGNPSLPAQPSPSKAVRSNLKIGVVQRFGTRPTDTLMLKAPASDRLTLQFAANDAGRQLQTVTTDQVKLEIQMQPLPQPILEERVVFSTHRSFESAEDSAQRWRERGIEVEVAQPERWQVWAKREVYNTPLLRRLLLQSVQAQGHKLAFIDSKAVKQASQVVWTVGNQRYSQPYLNITAEKGVIEVSRVTDEQKVNVYGGALRLQPNAYSTYTLVNIVPLETYLRGVVPHEIGRKVPQASIEAQAILARTYVLRNLRRFQIDGYELCADTQCQVYEGLTGTYAPADQAIAKTKGQVLTYNNELIDALYFSTSGGITAAFSDVWNGPNRPYLKPVVDSAQPIWDLAKQNLANEPMFQTFISRQQGFNEVGQPRFRWQIESNVSAMTKQLKDYLQKNKKPLADFKTIQHVQVSERATSGRVQKLAITTDLGNVELEKDEIIQAFEAPNSLLFYLQPNFKPDKTLRSYTFIGGGFGHGVGLSQTGSYQLGDLGWTYDRILSFYYPGTQLQPLSSSITLWRAPGIATATAE